MKVRSDKKAQVHPQREQNLARILTGNQPKSSASSRRTPRAGTIGGGGVGPSSRRQGAAQAQSVSNSVKKPIRITGSGNRALPRSGTGTLVKGGTLPRDDSSRVLVKAVATPQSPADAAPAHSRDSSEPTSQKPKSTKSVHHQETVPDKGTSPSSRPSGIGSGTGTRHKSPGTGGTGSRQHSAAHGDHLRKIKDQMRASAQRPNQASSVRPGAGTAAHPSATAVTFQEKMAQKQERIRERERDPKGYAALARERLSSAKAGRTSLRSALKPGGGTPGSASTGSALNVAGRSGSPAGAQLDDGVPVPGSLESREARRRLATERREHLVRLRKRMRHGFLRPNTRPGGKTRSNHSKNREQELQRIRAQDTVTQLFRLVFNGYAELAHALEVFCRIAALRFRV